jgi:hypothetical protein
VTAIFQRLTLDSPKSCLTNHPSAPLPDEAPCSSSKSASLIEIEPCPTLEEASRQVAHIGTYALPASSGWAAHIAGHALPEIVSWLLQPEFLVVSSLQPGAVGVYIGERVWNRAPTCGTAYHLGDPLLLCH